MAVPGTARFLLSEALRGDGAWLLNVHGERFMTRYEPAGELASRDLVARAIVREEARTGAPVTLSMRHLDAEWVRERFPDDCRRLPRARPRPGDRCRAGVAGGALHHGRRRDRHLQPHHACRACIAAGEVACTGVHGANRLASNSLLEGLVFGARAGGGDVRAARAGEIDRPRPRGPMPAPIAATTAPDRRRRSRD